MAATASRRVARPRADGHSGAAGPAPPAPVTPPRPVRPAGGRAAQDPGVVVAGIGATRGATVPASAVATSTRGDGRRSRPLRLRRARRRRPSPLSRRNHPEPDRSGAPPSTAAGEKTSTNRAAITVPQERGGEGSGRSAVASRTRLGSGGPRSSGLLGRSGGSTRCVPSIGSRRGVAGHPGTTLLRIHIEVDGHVSDVSVQRSAGHQSLDEAAADAVRRWRFEPALNSAGPVSMWAVVPVGVSDRRPGLTSQKRTARPPSTVRGFPGVGGCPARRPPALRPVVT